jgi:hypothetical protein
MESIFINAILKIHHIELILIKLKLSESKKFHALEFF